MQGLTKEEKRRYVDLELPVEQAVIVPSTQNVDKKISTEQMQRRVQKVKKYLAKKFGGFTSDKEVGGYYSSDKDKVIQEDVNIVTSYATKKSFSKNREALLKQLGKWGKKWGQESIGYELEDDLYYIRQRKPRKNLLKNKIKRKIKSKKVLPRIRRMNRMPRIRKY